MSMFLYGTLENNFLSISSLYGYRNKFLDFLIVLDGKIQCRLGF